MLTEAKLQQNFRLISLWFSPFDCSLARRLKDKEH
jgi:hypothetical protein